MRTPEQKLKWNAYMKNYRKTEGYRRWFKSWYVPKERTPYKYQEGYWRYYHFELKLEVYSHYGGPLCCCCGESHVECLSMDHIHGGGNKERKTLKSAGKGGTNFYNYLRAHSYPPGYQVMCFNCNRAKVTIECEHHKCQIHCPRHVQ